MLRLPVSIWTSSASLPVVNLALAFSANYCNEISPVSQLGRFEGRRIETEISTRYDIDRLEIHSASKS